MTIPHVVERKRILQSSLIGAAIFAVAVAILPIVCAALGVFGSGNGPRTAFASAQPGQYAVVAQSDGTADIVAIAPSDGSGPPKEVARVAHLDGFGVKGAVSPDGQKVAVVAATAGTAANPLGSLLVIDLATGKSTTLISNIDAQQTPAWANTSDSVVVTRDEGSGPLTVQFLSVPVDGGEAATVDTVESVLGAYAVGFDKQGQLVDVAIDAQGSTVRRAGKALQLISTQVTRDWQLSPDGTQMAYIESSLVGGLQYTGHTVTLDGSAPVTAEAQTASQGQQLGVAWRPGGSQATFGNNPATGLQAATAAGAEAQTAGDSGFNIPLGYSRDGSALAVQHWSGKDFASAGQPSLQLVRDGTPIAVDGYTRFLGWTAR